MKAATWGAIGGVIVAACSPSSERVSAPIASSSPPSASASAAPSASASNAEASNKKPPPSPSGSGTVRISTQDVAKQISAMRSQFRRCYHEQGLAKDPTMAGTVIFTVRIGPTGSIDDITNKGSGLSQAVVDCIDRELRTLAFNDGPTTINIPFRFVASDAGP